jgi:FAD/FMN-containing dehydrogenase
MRADPNVLRSTLKGNLHLPGEPQFNEACTIWNAMIERRPAFVVRPGGPEDIAEAIAFAKANGLPLSVRGGGHNVAGAALSDGGVTIDMSQRRAVSVDTGSKTVTVEAGATWKDVDAATQPHGLVVPSGIISATGVAGFTLGAGFGWTSRKFGFAADNLIAADVVTADGKALRASADENADLFWALRGGSGNFAVVTDFTFRAHAHGPQVLAGMVVHPFERVDEVIGLFRKVTQSAPDEFTGLLVLRKAPPAPWIPQEFHGKAIAGIAAHWTGKVEDGLEAMRPLKEFGPPIADTIAPKEYTAFQTFLDGGQPFGRRYYWKSDAAAEIGEGLQAALRNAAAQITSPLSAILVMQMGGAPSRVPAEATAVGGIRNARYSLVFQGAWIEGAEDKQHIGWARASAAAVGPFSSGAPYINIISADEGSARVQAAYGGPLYDRLAAIKRRYDPDNILRGTLNIPPAEAA